MPLLQQRKHMENMKQLENGLAKMTNPLDLDALRQVLVYLWESEKLDYFSSEGQAKETHIFKSIVRLNRWYFDPSCESCFFGGCPLCGPGQNDGYTNVGRIHWFVCHVHSYKWC